jgi:Uncharacterized protein conserved in bacteria (DUF2147)
MGSYCSTENPDSRLARRTIIGLRMVEDIAYQGNNTWGSAKIYDPNTGHTYDAGINLIGPNTVIVRGHWKFKWLGGNMVFNRMAPDGAHLQARHGNDNPTLNSVE